MTNPTPRPLPQTPQRPVQAPQMQVDQTRSAVRILAGNFGVL